MPKTNEMLGKDWEQLADGPGGCQIYAQQVPGGVVLMASQVTLSWNRARQGDDADERFFGLTFVPDPKDP